MDATPAERAGPRLMASPPGEDGQRWLAPVGIAIAAFAAAAIYLAGFGSEPIRNLGTDSFGYVAQIRAARTGVLDLQEERPGVAGVPLGGAWAVAIVLLTTAVGWVPLPRSG